MLLFMGNLSTLLTRSKFYGPTCLLLCFVSAGCLTVQTASNPTPFEHRLVRDQLVLHSDFELAEHHRVVEDLTLQREIISEKLGIPSTDEPIHIYLFADDTSYYDFLSLRFPNFPSRRAIFVETDIELSVYAHWGDRVAEDLRHEVAHGYLHAAIPNLPLWLDEGLAEYFEVGQERKGLNRQHVDLLMAQKDLTAWLPELKRLERLTSAADMTQQDYAESWAWVHFLLESGDDKAGLLTEYLADLRQGAAEAMLSSRLEKRLAEPKLAMLEHLQMLR